MTEEQLLALLEQLGSELAKKFTKRYSSARLEQIMSHLGTMKMLVQHIHDEATREEDPARKESVVERMVRDERRPMAEAQTAVEAGER